MKAHDWRRLARILHRDLGYLSFGLCLVYAVSGICLNHLKDWNSNHSVHRATVHTAPLAAGQGCPGRQVSSLSRAAILPTRIFGPSAHQIGPSPSQTAIGVQTKAAAAARMVAGMISSSIILR